MKDIDIEIGKSLLNDKRSKILKAVKYKAKSIKEISDDLGEKPSRLYYHINKLEEIGLLEVVEEKKIGNLIQKYYLGKQFDLDNITFDGKGAKENASFLVKQLYTHSNEAIKAIRKDLVNAGGDNTWKSNSEASLIRVELSEKEWRQLNIDIRNLIENRISKTSQIIHISILL